MSDKGVFIKYKNGTILHMKNDGEYRLLTKRKYMEDDLDVEVNRDFDESDEGKVVSGGELVDQTSTTKTANGTYDTTTNDEVVVNVPNTYSASDEGKVVDNGALVAQTSITVTENDTYDTTTNDEVVVEVENSYSASDEGKVVDGGELVAQGSQTITENGTYDTTLISELIADIAGGGGEVSVKDIVNILNKGIINSIVPFYTSATNPTGYTLSYSSQGGSSTPAWAIFNKTIDPVTSASTSNVRWTTSQSAPQWVQIQLPEAKKINSFYISTYLQSGTNTCKTYKIQGSNDGATFTDIFTETLEDEAIGKYVALPQESDAYSYYRIVVTESYHNTYIGLTSFFPMFIDA